MRGSIFFFSYQGPFVEEVGQEIPQMIPKILSIQEMKVYPTLIYLTHVTVQMILKILGKTVLNYLLKG